MHHEASGEVGELVRVCVIYASLNEIGCFAC